MPNVYYTLRKLHGTNTDIPFSSDRTVTTNITHVRRMQTSLKCPWIIIQHLRSRQPVEHKGLETADFEGFDCKAVQNLLFINVTADSRVTENVTIVSSVRGCVSLDIQCLLLSFPSSCEVHDLLIRAESVLPVWLMQWRWSEWGVVGS